MSTSTAQKAAVTGAVSWTTRIVRRSSVQATRRAVLHVQAPSCQPAADDFQRWFTERAFHFYVAEVRLPAARSRARRADRDLGDDFADLDATYNGLRGNEGLASVIVTAHGRAAVAAALWVANRALSRGQKAEADGSASQGRIPEPDALILSAPAWPLRGSLKLEIPCPVLVVDGPAVAGASEQGRPRQRRRSRPAVHLGSHVTSLALPAPEDGGRPLLDEVGRWLGAYMYGPGRDQLL